MKRCDLLLAAMETKNIGSSVPTSQIYRNTLNPARVMSFATISAQQTPEGIYPMCLSFNNVNGFLRMRCGYGNPGCNATCNPSKVTPVTCNSKISPHVHDKNDMIPTAFGY